MVRKVSEFDRKKKQNLKDKIQDKGRLQFMFIDLPNFQRKKKRDKKVRQIFQRHLQKK